MTSHSRTQLRYAHSAIPVGPLAPAGILVNANTITLTNG